MEAKIFRPLLRNKKNKGEGDLYGFANPKTGDFIVLSDTPKSTYYEKLGVWTTTNNEVHIEENRLVLFIGKEPECYFNDGKELQKVGIKLFDYEDLFARNFDIYSGLSPKNKKVLIIGCGSVGSLCAIELAKSGVENFTLVDSDTISLSNMARQQFDLRSIGRRKADALADMMTCRNPSIKVNSFPIDILKVTSKEIDSIFKDADEAIVCTDSIQANVLATYEIVKRKIPSVYISCYERAQSGEIVFYKPDITPCYLCAVGFRAKHHNPTEKLKNQVLDYSVIDDISRLMAEPGLAINIDYITNLGLMFALSLLLGENSSHYKALIEPLLPNRNVIFVNSGSKPHLMFQHPFEVVYGEVRRKICPACQKEEFEESLIPKGTNSADIEDFLKNSIEKES